MKRKIMGVLFVLFLIGIVGCSSTATKQEPSSDWAGDFSDLPSDYEEDLYKLDTEKTTVEVDGEDLDAYLLTGNNGSDDLFMFLHKKFSTGEKNIDYSVTVSFDLVTNIPSGMVGIGGSPGESVYVKAGVINKEPNIEKKQLNGHEMLLLNIDKGNQAEGGQEMIVLGNIVKVDGSEDESYQIKHFEQEFEVQTNENGEFYVLIGTDSGFEGTTTLYYSNINVQY